MEETPLNTQLYGELLIRALPCVIDTPEDHERLLTFAEELMDKGDTLNREERKLLEMLVLLIEVFEREVEEQEEDEVKIPAPHETLQRLMEARHWEPMALNDIFGNPKLSAEVLEGRKSISRGQAKELGKLFRVPPKLFLPQSS